MTITMSGWFSSAKDVEKSKSIEGAELQTSTEQMERTTFLFLVIRYPWYWVEKVVKMLLVQLADSSDQKLAMS